MKLTRNFGALYVIGLFFAVILIMPTGQARAAGSCFCLKNGTPSCQALDAGACMSSASTLYGSCSWDGSEIVCNQHVQEINLLHSSTGGAGGTSPSDDPLAAIKAKAQLTLGQLPVTTTPQQIIGIAIRGLTMFMGSIMFVLVVYAGVMWMTAQGNSERIEKAKNIMIWAALGVAVMLLSYIVVNFVFGVIQNTV